MSMISSQCDERLDERLRRAAQTCRELGKHTTANMFLEAADTILELRDDLQLANAAVQDAEHDESMAWDRVRKVECENAKLREYAESYAKAVECEGCGWCPYDIDAVCDTETMPMRDGCKLYDELRELGIEA